MKLTLRIIFIFLITLTLNLRLNAQDPVIDSLKTALKNAKHDTTRCNILSELIDAENDDKVWSVYNEQLLKLAENGAAKSSHDTTQKFFYLKHLAGALNNIGFLAQNKGDVPKALEYYLKSLKIEEEIKNKKGIAYSLNNIGSIYKDQGDISKGLEYYHKSLKMREEIKDKKGIATALNNIGIIHKNQGDAQKGLEYYHKSLKIQEEIKDKYGIASSLNNIGFIYDNHGDPSCHSSKEVCLRAAEDKALEYYLKSLKIREEINDKLGIAQSFNNIGGIYSNRAESEQSPDSGVQRAQLINKALEYYQKGLKIQDEIKDKSGIASSLINIGNILLKQGKAIEALALANRSLQTSKELGYPKNIMSAASALKNIYQKQNKFKEALAMYELEIQMRDSISNEATKKASIKKQFQYQYEKQAAADSVKNVEEQKVKNALLIVQQAQLKQEKTQRFALYGGLALMLVFAGFMFNRFKVTQQQKNIITLQKTKVDEAYKELNHQNEEIAMQRDEIQKQKHKVEEHQKEIIDSITYAKRLQEAILPSKDFVTEHLPENFILYKPKDLVAGDFYWAESVGNKFLIAAADSTGHGVPGAMVSVVCSNALNRSLKEFGLTEPGQLLDKTRELVLETFSKSSSDVKDGMDISLLCIEFPSPKAPFSFGEGRGDEVKVRLTWSGANNPLWYINNSVSSSGVENKELIEIKANKQPIGKTEKPTSFTTHEIEYVSGTTFYLLTDGYADQFGGPKGKKFMYKQLKQLLIANVHLSMTEQSEILNSKFNEWKGDLEQVDDVCIIGIKI